MPRSISIVTFISGTETLNHNIISFFRYLKKYTERCELLIYTDNEIICRNRITDKDIREIVEPAMTKYKRILSSLNNCKYEHILFIDNDVRVNFSKIKKFVLNCPENADIYFGKIAVSKTDSFTEHLVKIDKILSHNIIRPTLWNMNVGISIPGQIFIIKKNSFLDTLKRYDTLFDDLTIGICAKENNMTVRRTKAVLGNESPSGNMKKLIKQRIRWAKGYSQTLRFNKNSSCYSCILIHGLAYHSAVAVTDIIEAILFRYSSFVSSLLFIIILLLLSDNNIRELPYAAAYMFIFPLIHTIWFSKLIKEIITAGKEEMIS